ncbi:MAG: PrsW family intramembrane metalloprotease [Thermodesulfobacteriota bacterium]
MPPMYVPAMILALGFAPGVFWLWYFYKQDELEPEPLCLVRNCFLLGMLTVVPVYFLEREVSVSPIFDAVITAPVVEESAKFLAVLLTIYRHPEFDEPMDGVIYAAAVALGFASLENVGYLYHEYSLPEGTFAGLSVIRAFFSVPGHAIWSGMWGIALGFAKCGKPRASVWMVLGGLAMAMVLHGGFNLLVSYGPLTILGLTVVIPVGWELLRTRMIEALIASPHASDEARERIRRQEAVRKQQSLMARWYEKRAVVVVLLFMPCFPVGLYGLWTTPLFSKPVKVTYAMLWVYLVVASLYYSYAQGL